MSYVDSRGVEWSDVNFISGLKTVTAMAEGNLPDEHDIAREPALAAMAVEQQQALHTLSCIPASFIESLACSNEAGDYPYSVLMTDGREDSGKPSDALKIIIGMAEQVAIDPMDVGRDVMMAEDCDREQVAVDLMRDLLVMHGNALDDHLRPNHAAA